MDYREALGRAAALYGIEPEYFDTWGRRHTPSEEAMRAMLSVFGVPVDSAQQIEEFLDRRALAYWSQSLDPAIVVRENSELVSIRIPAESGGSSIKLEFQWEDGSLEHHWYWLPETATVEQVEVHGRTFQRKSVPLPKSLRLGYHTLRAFWMKNPELELFGTAAFIVCPVRARTFDSRTAGFALSLYGLRSSHNWGFGDFTDLSKTIDALAPTGIQFIALNPLHAIANRQPYNTSPYLPQSSLFRNPLYLDVTLVPGYREDGARSAEIGALRETEFVEYERVAQLKLGALTEAFDRFLAAGSSSEFDAWAESEGQDLRDYAAYCALDEELHRRNPDVWLWTDWPPEYRDPRSPAVEEFVRANATRVRFFEFLQWQVDRQIAAVQAHALEAGMKIGLYHDLALATDRYGADLWMYGRFFVSGARVGAPADDVAPSGQDWGFPPPNREAHKEDGYRHFAKTIRKNARHGGALRIDHVMRFFRLYSVPDELPASAGLYLRDNADDLLGVLTLESVRNNFIVVGEDLGTVADDIRHRLAESAVLGYRLLWFEKDGDGTFRRPDEYPEQAAVSTTTHDLPTLKGFVQAADIDARKAAGLIDDNDYGRQKEGRQRDVDKLQQALWSAGMGDDALRFLFATPSRLAIVNQEDLTGELYQQNLPASTWQYPNWRRKMIVPVEDLWSFGPRLRELLESSGRLT